MRHRAGRLVRAGLGALAACVVISLRTDAVELVADLNQQPTARPVYAGYPGLETPHGSFLLMVESTHGMELWISDHTPQGTRLVKDINAGWRHSVNPHFIRLGDDIVFLASDGIHGTELWRSDGTAAGTFMLADIGPGPQSFGGENPTASTVLDGVLYFVADDGVTGQELWRTDGTREGTYLFADMVPGYQGSYPVGLTVVENRLYFGLQNQNGLWISDGTSAGTRQFGMNASIPRAAEDVLFFFASYDSVPGAELFTADLDGTNIQMVAQNLPSRPWIWVTRGNSLIFKAETPYGVGGSAVECRLYRADAGAIGITELVNLGPSRCHYDTLINLPGGTMFGLRPDSSGANNELWVTDGTPAGTVQLDTGGAYYSYNDPSSVKVAYGDNGEAYFFARRPPSGPTIFPDKVWRTDGTPAGTRVFADLGTISQNHEIAYLNGRVYFDTGLYSPGGAQLWTSDGTAAGTHLVRAVNPVVDAIITDLRVVRGRLQFFSTGVGAGRELWISDGTFDGTMNLITTHVGSAGNASSNVTFAGTMGARALFTADRGSGLNVGNELLVTDGTGAGTSVIRAGSNDRPIQADKFLALGDQFLFVARSFVGERGLWRTDGTDAGTFPLDVLVVELGDADSIVGGVAYFTAAGASWSELWRTDGTPAGTFRVPGNVGQHVHLLGATGTHLLYQALSGGTGMRLWSWDGSQAQIISAADTLKIVSSAGTALAGRVCFRAWDVSPQHVDIWCANGLPGDVVRATDFHAMGLSAGDLHALGDKLLIDVPSSGASRGLYVTQGSAAGTQRISAELIDNSKPYGQRLVFVSESNRLMVTDGTSGGTRDLLAGVTLPGELAGTFGVLGNYVVFMVNDASRGAVLWRTDGTPGGTRYVADLDTGTMPAQTDVGQFLTLGERLLFSGYQTRIGNELWSLNATDPNASNDLAAATAGSALTINVLENDADFDGAINATSVAVVTTAAHGTVAVNGSTGAITYTASSTYNGTDTFSYRVSDDQGRPSNAATVTVQVTGGTSPPPPPPASSSSGGGSSGGGGALGLELWALLLLALGTLRPASRARVR